MNSTGAIVLCLAYVLGLLLTAFPYGGYGLPILGIIAALTVPRFWRTAPGRRLWFAAGVVGLVAALYLQWRTPVPQAQDISRLLSAKQPSQEAIVQGQIDSTPRVTRSGKAQFWLNVQQVGTDQTSGRLYVTVPLLQATGLDPGLTVQVTGTLYAPKPAANPGGFDFQKYLAQEGCFAGMRGAEVQVPRQSLGAGLWQIRQRIVRSQIQWLGSPEGPLLSAMVIGSRGVDLPYYLKDQFTQVGLAHALAASGFQTSLILGVVLALTQRFSSKVQVIAGTLSLAIFVGLTGIQPAVLRAAVMGFGGLVALALKRKTKPLGALLLTAVLLLAINPLWIWDLGFQLSFLATLGLLVTTPAIAARLDRLPSAAAPLLSVPIAAYLWTLPLQLMSFGVVSPYSIPVNVLTTPLISVISIGGMVSALAGLVWFPAGSALAWLLKYPTQLLIAIVNGFSWLPGNGYAVGTISVLAAIVLYGLIGVTWLHPWWRKRWWVALAISLSLVVIPAWQAKATQFQVTTLATSGQPVMVIQDGGRTALVNAGDAATVNFAVLPFLQKQGVNAIDWAIVPKPWQREGWDAVTQRLPIHRRYALSPKAESAPQTLIAGQTLQIGSWQVRLLSASPIALEFAFANQRWLWLEAGTIAQQEALLKTVSFSKIDTLWWSGKPLHPKLLETLKPATAIATASVNSESRDRLKQAEIQLFTTEQEGAIVWIPKTGFRTTLESGENSGMSL